MATAAATANARPVPKGPVAYRRTIRRLGPLMALAVPGALLGLGALIWVAWPCDGVHCVTPSLLVYGLALFALPTAVPAGLPLFATPFTILLAVVTSVVVWLVLGRWAAKRATASPVATWRDWFRELAMFTGAMWAGVIFGLMMTAFLLSR